MRVKFFIPALVVLVSGAFGEAKSKSIDLTGNWKETKRYTATKDQVSYTDTLRIDFLIGNEYVWQRDMGFMNRGTYKVTAGSLDFGTRLFTVDKMTNDRMTLRNDAGIYEFSRYNKNTGEDNSKAGSATRANNADAPGGQVKKENLAGKWEVYKRTSAIQQTKIDYNRILKSITISIAGGKVQGTANAAQMSPGNDTWTIERYDGGTLYCTGPDKRSFKVLQASARELVLQEGDMTYFFKIFQ